MQVRMLRSVPGAANARGSRTRLYPQGEIVEAAEPWQRDLAAVFLREGWAEPVGREIAALPGAPEAKPARRRKA